MLCCVCLVGVLVGFVCLRWFSDICCFVWGWWLVCLSICVLVVFGCGIVLFWFDIVVWFLVYVFELFVCVVLACLDGWYLRLFLILVDVMIVDLFSWILFVNSVGCFCWFWLLLFCFIVCFACWLVCGLVCFVILVFMFYLWFVYDFVVMVCCVGWFDLLVGLCLGCSGFCFFLFLIVYWWFADLVIFDCGILIYGGLL